MNATTTEPEQSTTTRIPRKTGRWKAPGLLLGTSLVAAGLFAAGALPRYVHHRELTAEATAVRHPIVNVGTATPADAEAEFILPGSVEAAQSTPIYPRVNGYVKRVLVDIGSRVSAGELLAEIETPELDEQVHAAHAALAQARANLKIAQTTAARWQELRRNKVVAPQEADERDAALDARIADVAAAEANVERLERQRGYQRIVAPFDGTITQRRIEVGQLVTGDLNDETRVLFRIEQTQTLRTFINVPQSVYRFVTVGQEVGLTFRELPGRTFAGKVIRTAGSLDATTRTLRTEIEIPNGKSELVPGLFAEVKFKVHREQPPIMIPARALVLQTDGPQIATLDESDRVRLASVTIERDLGKTIEIASGLPAGTRFVENPTDTLRDGTTVIPAAPPGRQ